MLMWIQSSEMSTSMDMGEYSGSPDLMVYSGSNKCPNVGPLSEEFVFVRDLEQIRTNICRVPEYTSKYAANAILLM